MVAHRPIFFAKDGCVVSVLAKDLIDALGVIERKSFVIVPGTVDGDVVVHMGDVVSVSAGPKRGTTGATDGGVGVVAVEGGGAVVFQGTKVWQREGGVLVVSLPGAAVGGFTHEEEDVGRWRCWGGGGGVGGGKEEEEEVEAVLGLAGGESRHDQEVNINCGCVLKRRLVRSQKGKSTLNTR